LSGRRTAGAVGLLFVALSISPERLKATRESIEHQAIAATAFTALVDALFLSMASLLPGSGTQTTAFALGLLTRPRASRAAAASAAGLFPWPVPQPFLRPLRLSVALVDNRYLLGPLEVRLADQRVGDEEFGEVTLMVLFLPDPALQLLLIIRDRALAAQVKGDGDLIWGR